MFTKHMFFIITKAYLHFLSSILEYNYILGLKIAHVNAQALRNFDLNMFGYLKHFVNPPFNYYLSEWIPSSKQFISLISEIKKKNVWFSEDNNCLSYTKD